MTVTVTPGRTAPVASVATPVSVPAFSCAESGILMKSPTKRQSTLNEKTTLDRKILSVDMRFSFSKVVRMRSHVAKFWYSCVMVNMDKWAETGVRLPLSCASLRQFIWRPSYRLGDVCQGFVKIYDLRSVAFGVEQRDETYFF